MKARCPGRRSAAGIAALLLMVLALGSSCGRGGIPGEAMPPGGPESARVRPDISDSSGWFPSRGPERLEEHQDLPLGNGAGFRDVQVIGTELFVLDSAGRLFTVSGDYPYFLPWREAAGGYGLTAMTADKAFAYILDENGTVRAFPLPSAFGSVFRPDPETWASSPGFIPDWILCVSGSVVCASSVGRIAVLSASDGTVRSDLDLGVPLAGKPAVAGTVLVLPRTSGLTALKLPDLEFLWSLDRPPSNSALLRTARRMLAFQDREGYLKVLDAETGAELYAVPAGENSAVACDGERWYIAGSDGSLGSFGVSDGVPVWTAGAARGGAEAVPGSSRFIPRLAVEEGRLFLAGPAGLEAWDSGAGDLQERVPLSGWVDGLYVATGRLFVRLRDGTLRLCGNGRAASEGLDMEAPVRPDSATAERIAARLEKYAEPGISPSLAWRAYVPEAVASPDYRFTVFRYEVREAGNRSFSLLPDGPARILVALFDSSGEERHSNIGELGVDPSFEQWLEAGVWYVAAGRLRGAAPAVPVFLRIR